MKKFYRSLLLIAAVTLAPLLWLSVAQADQTTNTFVESQCNAFDIMVTTERPNAVAVTILKSCTLQEAREKWASLIEFNTTVIKTTPKAKNRRYYQRELLRLYDDPSS